MPRSTRSTRSTRSPRSASLVLALTLAASTLTACGAPPTPGSAVISPTAPPPAEPPPPPPLPPAEAAKCPNVELGALPGEPVVGEWVTTPSCLRYTVLRPGAGAQPRTRLSTVRAHYTGWLTDGTQFDSSRSRGKPFDFRLSQVIPGWTEAMLGMRAGEKRKLVIPYKLAYGREGNGNIPPKATLVFDVELIDVLVE
ncbi:MAG: FKBP-type peptidyl-prolyl cis-trans isomerase [Myxococcales bacterium]|nr:FKBP-type peptidyl-prolyl cis-trans isomerase [Myxococcales bacterium]HQY63315.1 FKBP-type peptidyl-prolyl cis-trans isomerase [Polyangiaceae bacterium]